MQIFEGYVIDSKWSVDRLFDESGQGQSAVVSDKEQNRKGVIKILKKSKDSERLKRFEREIDILQKLKSIERIPEIYEINEEEHYYIMEYIEGDSLSDTVSKKSNKKNFDKIMMAIMTLLQIVREYSELGVVHRDIKPDNIICKGGNIEDIYLIDFGIAYDNSTSENLTQVQNEMGNRFLNLPELKSGNKHDIRSDITFCIGILFFMLTNIKPRDLLDSNSHKPNETALGIERLQWVGTRNCIILNRIFDKGFNIDLKDRFRNVEDLEFALNEINTMKIGEGLIFNNVKKSDSFCLSTIKEITGVNDGRRENARQRLKNYDGKRIAIADPALHKRDEKIFFEAGKFDLINQIIAFSKIDDLGLFIGANKFNEFIDRNIPDEQFEIVAKMKVCKEEFIFSEYSLRGYSHEVSVQRMLEPLLKIDMDNVDESEIEARFLIKNNRLIVLKDEIKIYNLKRICDKYQAISIRNLDIDSSYRMSSNLKWLAYKSDEKIKIAEVSGDLVTEKKFSFIQNIQLQNFIDYRFGGEKLLLLFSDRLIVIDLNKNKSSEISISRRGFLRKKIIGFDKISNQGKYCYLRTNRTEKIYVDLINYEIDRECVYENIIESLDNKYIYYSSWHDRICRETIDGKTKETLYEDDKFRYGFSYGEIKCEGYNYFFAINRGKEYNRQYPNDKISVLKIINNELIKLCSIGNKCSICEMWVQGGYLISSDDNNQITVWKING